VLPVSTTLRVQLDVRRAVELAEVRTLLEQKIASAGAA
jgi:hypothetical protein